MVRSGGISIRTFLNVGAVFDSLKCADIPNFQLKIPPLAEQVEIAEVLGSLDKKIQLNRQMNDTLEDISRAIFKSWFVDFDPVYAKAEGQQPTGISAEVADLFPGRLETAATGTLPAGWPSKAIRDIATTIQYGFTQSASQSQIGPKFLRITDIQGGRVDWSAVPFCEVTQEEYERYRLLPGDVLVARTGASTGENIYLADPPDSVFASYLVRFQFATQAIARYVGEFMRSAAYFDYVGGSLGGSAQPNASAQTLAGAKLVVPPPRLLEEFLKVVHPMDMRRVSNGEESVSLANLRDALLPKLLSGEIRVKDARALEAAR